MSKNTWDAVLASAPLNSTAGKVTSKGENFVPEEMNKGLAWDDLPPLKGVPAVLVGVNNFEDLTGRVFGRLTVVGMLDGPDNSVVWVSRCKCGRFCGNRTKALKSGNRDRCDYCNYTGKLAFFASGNNARKRAANTSKRRWTLP